MIPSRCPADLAWDPAAGEAPFLSQICYVGFCEFSPEKMKSPSPKAHLVHSVTRAMAVGGRKQNRCVFHRAAGVWLSR